eukprot:6255411-Pyramimonas_sp.AAC.1
MVFRDGLFLTKPDWDAAFPQDKPSDLGVHSRLAMNENNEYVRGYGLRDDAQPYRRFRMHGVLEVDVNDTFLNADKAVMEEHINSALKAAKGKDPSG